MDTALEVACAQRKLERKATQFARDFSPKPQPNREKIFSRKGNNEVTHSGSDYVYVITHPDFDGWVKVGQALNMKNRMSQYNTGSPVDYTLVKQWKVMGAIADKTLHNALEAAGIERKREWFKADEVTVLAYLDPLIEQAVENYEPEPELSDYELNAVLNPDKHLAEWIAQNT